MTPGDRIPTRTGRRPLRRLAAAVAGAALATGALALAGLAQGSGPDGALSASAHNYLVSSSPAAGSTIDAPPSEVTLTFNDVILDLAAAGGAGGDASTGSAPAGGSSVVQVTGPDGQGRHFETGCATDSGRSVTVPVALGGSGQYTVTWRVVSADGHPVSDSIAFTYQAPAGATASAGTADGPGCAAAQEGAAGSGAASSGGTASGGTGGADTSAADPGTAAGQEQGVAPYLGVIVGVGIGIVVLAAAAVVLIVVTGRRKPAAAAATDDADGDTPRDGGPPGA
ncbi:copper resistance CopC family protein [Clavibacter sepedonicus]|uniref:Membrane protein n=1 Tax=Clavibacter sepedonicus TaxID=31964 RepID=B0RBJ5_CLASE|nr:copper resistance CopC family protein [Clavibacter sepedonicus]OQJ48413.1 copper resistance protein CopC [Clavibacter sepedonicus]OQJ53895.1 copper resistance protein CopC [Clavibacter sepedonicus]UUK65412.1 copper resistance protein CopC [Clavibacter sepedonicus]CAQ02891.1 putative membrane protein [Clavibacter sepedonicus]